MIAIIVGLVLVGFALFLINLIPMPAWVKQVITALAILFVVLYLLNAFGLYHFPMRLR